MTFQRTAALLCLLSLTALEALPIGIIGGQDTTGTNPAYAALVQADGTLTQLTGGGLPTTNGDINSVAINISGMGIIGGRYQTGAYAALVTPNGTLTDLSSGFSSGSEVDGVAINSSGAAILGGDSPGFAFLVAPNGTLTTISGPNFPSATNGFIFSVAINNSGVGIIGGNTSAGGPSYAALVATNGTATPLSSAHFPSTGGDINSVAINDSGSGLIGGRTGAGAGPAFAALVAPNGTLTELSGGGLPATNGQIESVAINKLGAGIIGGHGSIPQVGYAALVTPSGTLQQLSSPNFPTSTGEILSVAINGSGAGIIGGENMSFTVPYAALVAPSGTLTELSVPSSVMSIPAVAINDAGVGLIVGQNNISTIPAYAALVAPNGTLTALSGTGFPSIMGVLNAAAMGLTPAAAFQVVTPQSAGAYTSSMNGLLMAAQVLEIHLNSQLSFRAARPAVATVSTPPALSQSSLVTRSFAEPGGDIVLQEYKEAQGKFTLWGSPFGDYLHQRKQGRVPAFTNKVAGGLLGFDYHPSNYLVGGGVAYAFNHIHYGQSLGHGNMQEEMAFAYYGYYARDVWFDVAAWGGLYQLHNLRHAPIVGTASCHIHGWLLDPHAEVATPIRFDWLIVEPFAMADWAMTWQNSFKEKNLAGFALKVGDQFTTLVRSEGGVRLYETVRYEWGKFVIEEKLSYINRAPVGRRSATVAFVGATSSFPIAIAPSHIENLGGAELRTMFLPWDNAYPYGILDGQIELGSSFQSYMVSFELGKNF